MTENFEYEHKGVRLKLELSTTHVDAHSKLSAIPREVLRTHMRDRLQVLTSKFIQEMEEAHALIDHP